MAPPGKKPFRHGHRSHGPGDPARSKEGWVKRERVWRSPQAQTPPAGDGQPSGEDGELRSLASSATGLGGYRQFGEIPAHRLGRALRGRIYKLANSLDSNESNNLASRLKYAATTATAALATGFGEGTFRSGIKRALESRGALLAIQDHLEQLSDQKLLEEESYAQLRKEVDEVVGAVNDFLGKLAKDQKQGRA